MSAPAWLIYGATGYTGQLIVRHARERGLLPILAGRDPESVAALADKHGLGSRVGALDDPASLDALLAGIDIVLHCAGPFSHTAEPMVMACLRHGAHYLDITGEIDVFEMLAEFDDAAREAGVMVLPGVGFDVVPSDCLAAHVAARVPLATSLDIAIRGGSGVSRGTAVTMLEGLPHGGLVRRGGALRPATLGSTSRVVDFGGGPRGVSSVPWGDLATAWVTTGIHDITTFMEMPGLVRRLLPLLRGLKPVLRNSHVQSFLRGRIRGSVTGPSDAARASGRTHMVAEARDASGHMAVSRLHGPEGYTFTARAAVRVVEELLQGRGAAGFQTPALAYGPDFVLSIEGVTREDVSAPRPVTSPGSPES